MKVDGLIFDLDGTLWDSTKEVAESWSKILSNYNFDKKEITVEELKPCMGKLLDEIAEMLFPNLDKETQIKVIHECANYENEYIGEHGAKLYDNLENTLKILNKNYKLFIVSNCQDGYIECFFKAHKLDKYFLDYECPGRTGLTKGENIKLIIERNNLKNPIYIGDTEGDMKAAKIADIPFVYAKYGFGSVLNYDYSINSFDELIDIKFSK